MLFAMLVFEKDTFLPESNNKVARTIKSIEDRGIAEVIAKGPGDIGINNTT